MNKEVYKEYIKPFIVLSAICLVVSGALGLTNMVTDPIIQRNRAAAAEATRKQLLPEATEFVSVQCEQPGIQSVYRDEGGSGYVFTASFAGYKGPVEVTVALSPEGEVLGLSADTSGETAGIGTKASGEDFLGQFLGLSGSAGVDSISGATYSSSAVIDGVNAVLEAFEEIKEANGNAQ